MSDERTVEVIATEMKRWGGPNDWNHPVDAAEILAALRANGFEVYRPEECERHQICTAHAEFFLFGEFCPWADDEPSCNTGTYRLVPEQDSR